MELSQKRGSHATYTAIEACDELGFDLRLHRATAIMDSDIQNMDLILCATSSHKNYIVSIFPNLTNKVFTLKEYVKYDTENGLDIPDPWGYDLATYRKCVSVIETCISMLIEMLLK